MQYDHKRHKAALEFLSEKFDLPISEVIDALDKNEIRPQLPSGHRSMFIMRDEYQALAGFAYEPSNLPARDLNRIQPPIYTGYIAVDHPNKADPIQIIRDLIADLGSTHAQMPSVRRAYAYLESIEPPFSTTEGN